MTLSPLAGERPNVSVSAKTTDVGPCASPEAGTPGHRRHARLAIVATLLFGAITLGPLVRSGLWEPFELATADQARRVAVNLFGAEGLRLPGAANDLPTLEELGRGELPLLWEAVLLRVFGLSFWPVRVAMATAGAMLLGVNYWGALRLWGPRVALGSTWVLMTMPAVVVQSRGAFGDAVTLLGSAAAFYGLSVAFFGGSLSRRDRLYCGLCAGAGVVVATLSRGVLVGVSLPCLAVGLAACASPDRYRRLTAWALVLGGGASAAVTLGMLWLADVDTLSRWVGTHIELGKKFWTHDQSLHFIGHAFFPWSVLIPAALGTVLGARGEPTDPRHLARRGLVLVFLLALVVYTLLGERTGLQPFAPVFALGGLVALAADEWSRPEREAPLSGALIALCLLVLLFVDFHNFPEKVFSAYSLVQKEVPRSVGVRSDGYFALAAGLSALPLLGLALADSTRSWPRLHRGVTVLRRRAVLLGAFSAAGAVLTLGYYPRLASALSPTGVFDAYAGYAEPGEPLATVGTVDNLAAFHGAPAAEHFDSETEALKWLNEASSARRWLAFPERRLKHVNSKFRQKEGRNLPVVGTPSSELLLGVNRLPDGATSQNPLNRWLPDAKPALAHPLSRRFGGDLELLGWEIRRADGSATDSVRVGEPLQFVLAYEVHGRLSKDWRTFIHIDGQGKRFNGDHDTLRGEYSMKLLQSGDWALDVFDFSLEPDLKPGKYTVYFGLFLGDERLEVTEGAHSENRVVAGTVEVGAP